MSKPIVSKSDQLVIIIKTNLPFRGGTWEGSIEIDGNTEYSCEDIMKLCNDDPETVMGIYKIGKVGITNLTDTVLDWAEQEL